MNVTHKIHCGEKESKVILEATIEVKNSKDG